MMRESQRLHDSNTNSNSNSNSNSNDDIVGILDRGVIVTEGTNLARALASLPPNILNPTTYADIITNISITHGNAHTYTITNTNTNTTTNTYTNRI